jgi:hypothetical protein
MHALLAIADPQVVNASNAFATSAKDNVLGIVGEIVLALVGVFVIVFILNLVFPKFFKIDKSSPFGL